MSQYIIGGGQPPVVERIMAEAAGDQRPDMMMMADHAGRYGIVMRGGTSADALAIYTNMAEGFTGYWNGELDQDAAIASVTGFMTEAFAD